MANVRWAAIALVCLSGLACKRATPGYCGDGNEAKCGEMGMVCSPTTLLCEPPDGGAEQTDAGDGGDAGDGPARCASDDDCKAAEEGPACVVETGRCVPCLENEHCPDKTQPLCLSQQCVPCTSDDQCATVTNGKGLCIVDGHCATADELVYVQNGPACLASGGGSFDHPFCTSEQGVAALGGGKSVLVLRGVVDPWSITAQPAGTTFITVIGQQDATVTAGSVNGVTIQGAKVNIRELHVTTGTAGGIAATADATLILDRSRIDNVERPGILIDASAYQITNTIVTGSGSIDLGAGTAYPAVVIRNSFGRSPSIFSHNTIANNDAALGCDAAYAIEASILTPSTVASGAPCAIAACCTATATDFSDAYHLLAGSSCIDQSSAGATTGYDIDGQARPFNDVSDCGADEYWP